MSGLCSRFPSRVGPGSMCTNGRSVCFGRFLCYFYITLTFFFFFFFARHGRTPRFCTNDIAKRRLGWGGYPVGGDRMTRAGVWACLFLLGIHGIHIGDRALGGRGRGDGVVCVLQCMERFHGPSCQDRESQKQARPNSRSTSPRRRLRRVSLHDMAREPQGVYIPHFYLHDMQWLLLTFLFLCSLFLQFIFH